MSSRKAERSEATRRALVEAARELFAERGFAQTATEAIVRRAQVTRGALYHHFRGKEDLFRAVYEDVEEEVTARAGQALAGVTDPLEALRVGADVFLDACLQPDVQRIVLLEGPTVLGWAHWREIDERYGLGLVKAGLQLAMEAGQIPKQPVEPLAHILLGALVEAGMVVANAPDQAAARREVGRAIAWLLGALAASTAVPSPAGRRRR